MKRIISAVAVLAIVSGALAFKPLGSGTIYCQSSCSTLINFQRDDANGTISDPCENGVAQEYFKDPNNGNLCTQITLSTAKFKSVAP
jgi:hypothetical protein